MTSIEILQKLTTNPKKKIYEKKKGGAFSINVPARKENAAEDSPLIQEQFFLH